MEITSDMITQFGLMNKISTGHSLLDVLLCMLVPLLINRFLPQIYEVITKWFDKASPVSTQIFSRTIEYVENSERHYWWYSSDDEPRNNVLYKAIQLYLNSLPKFTSSLATGEVQLRKVDAARRGDKDDDDDESESSFEYCDGNNNLSQLVVSNLPEVDDTVEVQPGLSIRRFTRIEDEKSKVKHHGLVLESTQCNGNVLIDEFIGKAFAAYKERCRAPVDKKRYMLVPAFASVKTTDDEDASTEMVFKRYRLSDDKTFSSLFHPDKEVIMKLVDDFTVRKGKFAIPGYPYKLGFLLHGEPGTGKTSFVKALAQHTGRHIVSIPLNRIRTNQQLMDLMLGKSYRVEGLSDVLNLPVEKVIFILEDIDAASEVVKDRSKMGLMSLVQAVGHPPLAKRTRAKGKKKSRRRTRGEDEGTESSSDNSDGEPSVSPKGPRGPLGGFGFPGFFAGGMGGDELNLAGLLNVLDGVVDTPGRIVVMTTNHPEQLDPALIRPGRINRKIYMGHIRWEEARQLIQHYLGDIEEGGLQRVQQVFRDGVLAPAAIECMCAEVETVQELEEKLRDAFHKASLL